MTTTTASLPTRSHARRTRRTLGELVGEADGFVQTGPFGSQLHARDYVDDGIPVVMPQQLGGNSISTDGIAMITERDRDRLRRHVMETGDIVFSRRGDVTRRALITDREAGWLCGTGCLLLRLRHPDCDNRYLVRYLGLPESKGYLIQHAVGATMPNLNQGILESVPVHLPSIAEQRDVVAFVEAYDDLIENNRRRIQLLEQAARLLYREWFVHLRFPGHEHVKITNGVPEGWEKLTFGEVVANYDSMRVPLSILEREQREGPFPYHGAAGVLGYIDDFLFDGRYLLVGEDGTVITPSGSASLQLVEGKFWVSNHAHVVQGKLISTEFIHCFMMNYPIQPHVTGVAQPKLSQANLNRIVVLVPSYQIRGLFQSVVLPLVDQSFILKSQAVRLSRARDLLLPRLMNGEVRL